MSIGDEIPMTSEDNPKPPAKRYYRKRVELFLLLDKIKLWTSRSATLHGLKSIERFGETARLTTHCGKTFVVRNSRNSHLPPSSDGPGARSTRLDYAP